MDNSPLKRLPAELRIRVYQFALSFERVSCISRKLPGCDHERLLSKQLALTQVCKQVRKESLHMPFTLNDPVIGKVPCAFWYPKTESSTKLSEIANTIENIPATLTSASTTFTLDLHDHIGSILRARNCICPTLYDMIMPSVSWATLNIILGGLMQINQTRKFLLDVTVDSLEDSSISVGRSRTHLRCDSETHPASKATRPPKLQLQPYLTVSVGRTGRMIPFALFNHAKVTAIVHEHEFHERSACNVTEHGKTLLGLVDHSVNHIIRRIVGATGNPEWNEVGQ